MNANVRIAFTSVIDDEFFIFKEIGLRVSLFPSFLEVREFPHDVKVATLVLYNNETAALHVNVIKQFCGG